MTSKHRAELEAIADQLESIHKQLVYIGDDYTSRPNGKTTESLAAIAWDIKQIARYGTPSFGV